MRVTQRLSRRLRYWLAEALRDRRPQVPYSYGWLNNLCWHLVARGGALALRPAYAWGTIQAAALGRALGCPRVAVVEFGVAGGRGLIALERIAETVEQAIGTRIDVYGFDSGRGLPKPLDHRDVPNIWAEGYFAMDEAQLRSSLRRATLILGPVAETVQSFLAGSPAPVGFVSFDLDYYSSTVDALRLFRADAPRLLPRVHCYFDDIMGLTFGDHNGERLAISEFNAGGSVRKLSPIYGLSHYLPWPLSRDMWCEMMYLAHIFDHHQYADNDGLAPGTAAPAGRV